MIQSNSKTLHSREQYFKCYDNCLIQDNSEQITEFKKCTHFYTPQSGARVYEGLEKDTYHVATIFCSEKFKEIDIVKLCIYQKCHALASENKV